MKGKLALVLGVLLVFGFVFAGCVTSGYKGPVEAKTVAEAKASGDDTLVRLQGKIERRLEDDKYLFSDSTGSITTEINFWAWRGLSVDENDMVEITGEFDLSERNVDRSKIDVKSIKKI